MVAERFHWERSYRIVAARVPFVSIFEDIARPEDVANVLALEALTNDRLREAAATVHLVPEADRVTGPGATFVMAPFAYVRPGRFSPGGVRGAYYAGESIETAIAETTYHRARFYAETGEKPLLSENRVIEARIDARAVDAGRADAKTRRAVLDPESYAVSFAFGARAYAQGHDAVSYPSVRRASGRCVAVFRPRCVRGAHTTKYLGYRWDGRSIVDVVEIRSLTSLYPAEPGAR